MRPEEENGMSSIMKMKKSVVGETVPPRSSRPIHRRHRESSPVRGLRRACFRVAALSPIVLSAACASIVSDNDTETYIATDPENARCELRGDDFTRVVNTPTNISLPADAAPITVTCDADGYRQTSQDIDTSTDGWILGNLIFGGVVGVAIDAARGAGQKYPAELTLVLEPESFDSVAARDAWYDARRRKIDEQWETAIQTIDNQCSRNMKDLCAEKKAEAEKLHAAEAEALEERRKTAVVGDPEGSTTSRVPDADGG